MKFRERSCRWRLRKPHLREDDRLSKERLEELQKELAEMREDFKAREARWENEKASVEKVSKLREEIESVNSEIQIAQRNYDLNKAAELQYGRLPELKKTVRRGRRTRSERRPFYGQRIRHRR